MASIAAAISLMNESSNSFWLSSSIWLSTATAAWLASDSITAWFSAENVVTGPPLVSLALSSCTTPMTSPWTFFIGMVRKDRER